MRLYVIVRTDMDSMNPGRVAAQVCHAGSDHYGKFTKLCNVFENGDYYNDLSSDASEAIITDFDIWRTESKQNTFGTTIVLDGGNWNSIIEGLNISKDYNLSEYFSYGIINDDTYPIKDGSVIHFVSIPTCIWVFCPDILINDPRFDYLKSLPLYTGVKNESI